MSSFTARRDVPPRSLRLGGSSGGPTTSTSFVGWLNFEPFGIARSVNSQQSSVTATGMVVGTPGYLAPEQLTGEPLTPAVDIFAWGATMVFAATGRSPFEADTLPDACGE